MQQHNSTTRPTLGYDQLPIEPDLKALFKTDSYLEKYEQEIRRRFRCLQDLMSHINRNEVGLYNFSMSYQQYGIQRLHNNSIRIKEWAPAAEGIYLKGDFNEWKLEERCKFTRKEFGRWELTLPPNEDGSCPIQHLCKLKLEMGIKHGKLEERISPWARYVTRSKDFPNYEQVFWDPPLDKVYTFRHPHPKRPEALKVYEAHVGICSWEGKVATYKDFTNNVIPRIVDLGYNSIQLMAVMEHAYYASFGYQVSSFFAASSRYGTPEELKELVDTAHSHGIMVLLDVVHSHASKNVFDGLNMFDGTNACYFHEGSRGFHDTWDSRIFDYTQWEVLRFLLSNLRMWVDDYHFDGFRFDGISSMLYHSHGMGDGFCSYDDYFGLNVDTESFAYLCLANHMLHTFYPDFIVTIAEEWSGMPTVCRPVKEGGCGFDFRLAMALPDMWINLLRSTKDEDWDLDKLTQTLLNRRWSEPCIAYAESHDQALVGDKTLAFWLMDKEMYTHMSITSDQSTIIDRGLALHMMIRLVTIGLGGEGYLNFIGNEFGHPEWLDFPRDGNGQSYHYCRRQWNLVDDPMLKYKFLNKFDRDMIHLESRFNWLANRQNYVSTKHNEDKVLVFDRADVLVFVFNFNHHTSFVHYKIGVKTPGSYRIVLDTDAEQYGGHKRLDHSTVFHTFDQPWNGRPCHMFVYMPTRTAFVLAKCDS